MFICHSGKNTLLFFAIKGFKAFIEAAVNYSDRLWFSFTVNEL